MKPGKPVSIGIAILAVATGSGIAVKATHPPAPSPFDRHDDIARVHHHIPTAAETQAYIYKLQHQKPLPRLTPAELAKERAKHIQTHAVAPVGDDNA